MNQNVKRILIIVAVLCFFFGTFFAVKYFHVSKETSSIIAISLFSFVILLEIFVKDPKENYSKTDEKQKVYKYSSLSGYNNKIF